jgi:hypothetical protein
VAGGGNYVLDKGYPVLATYNGSAAAGVTRYRAVKFSVAASVARIDLNVAATVWSIGVVQEDIDAVKVAYGNAVANVALMGITKMYANATPGAIVLGSPVMVGNAGGAILATGTSTNFAIGICVGMSVPGGTVAAGDLIDVLLTPSTTKFL